MRARRRASYGGVAGCGLKAVLTTGGADGAEPDLGGADPHALPVSEQACEGLRHDQLKALARDKFIDVSQELAQVAERCGTSGEDF
jgi:hypothetical protein